MKGMLYVTALALACVCALGAQCPAMCRCPPTPPHCPPGVDAVPDGCGCCKVCPRRLNQDCRVGLPCDASRGLYCNYGNSHSSLWGICRAGQEGRSCEYSGRIYQSGEVFRPSCAERCSCVDGTVGCEFLCPGDLQLSSAACPRPLRLLRPPGRCCHTLVCHKGELPPPLLGKSKSKSKSKFPKSSKSVLSSKSDYLSLWGGWGERRKEEEEEEKGRREREQNELYEPEKDSERGGHKHLAAWRPARLPVQHCVVQMTDWSPCSRSCGMGVSLRVTNQNGQCRPERETRLCNPQPCDITALALKEGTLCSGVQHSPEPVHLWLDGCRSVRRFRLLQCGQCAGGRCCRPRRLRRLRVEWTCAAGQQLQREVSLVQSCHCTAHCPLPPLTGPDLLDTHSNLMTMSH
ncbi:CCN family member 1 isoform X2 [Amia ocellicauda]|uniref:CCN family member 1 isoform X2 n=1 Tax=Amia ocellicauda TaxID=2972642 RepID=UPI0034648E46